MSNTRDTGFLRNAIQVTDQGVTFVSGSTTLMSISSSGAVTTTGVISGSNALSASYSISGSYAVSSSYAFTASSAVSASYILNAVSASKAVSSSYSDTASFSNNFTVLGNLTVYGTQSVQYITSSQLNVSDNVITVNVASPGVRFGGLSVYDSGSLSSEATASLFWDSQNNHWIYQRESGSTYNGGMLISGPRNFAGLGNEQGTTSGSLMKGQGGDHVTSSAIFEDGYKATVYTNALVVSSSGNVGIGTTNPGAKLTVIGADGGDTTPATYGGTIKIVDYGVAGPQAIGGLEFRDSAGYGSKIYTNSANDHLGFASRLGSATWTEHVVIKQATGNVGIGTSSPTAKIEARGSADGDLFIGRFSSGAAKLIYAYQYGSDGYLELRTGADAIITKLSGYTGTPSYFLSNVGINTTGSNSRVTIVDNNAPNASGNITSGTQFAASIAAGYASLNLGAYDDGSSNRYGYLRTAYSDNAGIPSEMRFYTAATERMRISTGGIVTQPYQPAFSIANGAALTGPGTVPFKNVIFDDGSNFNTSTYRFTAPVAGRYFFSFYDNIYANVAPSPSMEFRVNGTRRGAIAYTNTKTIGYWYIMSFQQVIKLSSGDYVEVYIAAGDSPDYGGDYSWGNFSGFLIG